MMEGKTIHRIIDELLVVVPGETELHYMHTIGLHDGVRGCIAALKTAIAADAVPVSGNSRTYDPATQIVVSREVAENWADLAGHVGGICVDYAMGKGEAEMNELYAELRAALEVK